MAVKKHETMKLFFFTAITFYIAAIITAIYPNKCPEYQKAEIDSLRTLNELLIEELEANQKFHNRQLVMFEQFIKKQKGDPKWKTWYIEQTIKRIKDELQRQDQVQRESI